jgi:hypothetical protein
MKPPARGKKPPSARDKKRPYRPPIGSVVSLLVPDFPKTPAGLSETFCTLATPCLEDAKKLDEYSEGYNSIGEYILIAHALELSLKAFLARHEVTEEELRKDPYGHNLDRLYEKAVELRRAHCLQALWCSRSLTRSCLRRRKKVET